MRGCHVVLHRALHGDVLGADGRFRRGLRRRDLGRAERKLGPHADVADMGGGRRGVVCRSLDVRQPLRGLRRDERELLALHAEPKAARAGALPVRRRLGPGLPLHRDAPAGLHGFDAQLVALGPARVPAGPEAPQAEAGGGQVQPLRPAGPAGGRHPRLRRAEPLAHHGLPHLDHHRRRGLRGHHAGLRPRARRLQRRRGRLGPADARALARRRARPLLRLRAGPQRPAGHGHAGVGRQARQNADRSVRRGLQVEEWHLDEPRLLEGDRALRHRVPAARGARRRRSGAAAGRPRAQRCMRLR
mmetsp:Transcript_92032/g.297893  ORF Transcript_92032/g.297893 Transcript_92032/m.297893 type:complete len:302 (-) Transcript_92032:1837-2742(-)